MRDRVSTERGSSYSPEQSDSDKKKKKKARAQKQRRREAAPLRVPGSRAKGLSWQNPAGSTHRGSPPPSHLVPCMAGGCHTLEVAVQRAHRWTRVYLFFWIPTDCPSGVRVLLKPHQMLGGGQKSYFLPPPLSWSEQSGGRSFAQMLCIDQADPREANPGWTDHAPYPEPCIIQGRCTQGALPAMPTVIPLTPDHTNLCSQAEST